MSEPKTVLDHEVDQNTNDALIIKDGLDEDISEVEDAGDNGTGYDTRQDRDGK